MHMGCQEPRLTTGCLVKYNSLEAYAGLGTALANAEEASLKHYVQWNLSVTTTSMIKFITCDLFSNVF